MSRRNRAPKRDILPDPKFDSILLSKFINMTMMSGKKSVAEKIIYGAIDIISDRSGKDDQETISLLTTALDNVKPSVEVKSRRVGGATYQVPVEVRSVRRETLAMRWVIDSARKRNEKTMAQRVAGELMDASENRGSAVKKREEVHKMAEANKAFAHFRW
jgi:small subunit ribosomal protein S7